MSVFRTLREVALKSATLGSAQGAKGSSKSFWGAASALSRHPVFAGYHDDGQKEKQQSAAGALMPLGVRPWQNKSIHTGITAHAAAPGAETLKHAEPGSGSAGFGLLAAAHAGLAVTAVVAPEALVNTFFPGAALPEGIQTQTLAQVLACGVAVGSTACLALKQAADAKTLASPTAQRLQLGLMGFSAGAIGLHLIYSPSITLTSLAAGAAVMGTTFAVPYSSYVRHTGPLKVGEVVKRYFGAVPDHLNVTGLHSSLYSLLTPALAAAGAAYLFLPGASLAAVFGYVKGVESFFLWQHLGAGLMTIAPAVTYSLKKEADEGRLGQTLSKTLNAGLLVAALGHVSVLYPFWAAGQGGPAVPWLLGAWATALGAAGLGIFSGSAGSAGAGAAPKV